MKLFVIATAICALVQERPFQAEVRVVQVPVSVISSKGTNVEGLKARDFLVTDNGAPREISLDTFGTGSAPISLVIAIQTSGVSELALAKIHRIGGMIVPLVIGRRGEAAIVTFDDEVNWRLDFTGRSEAIQKSVKAIEATPGNRNNLPARMRDAVVDSTDLMKNRKGRRVLLLISESKDRGSHAHLDRALEAVERDGIEVFAANYSDPDIAALTQATGGKDYSLLREHGIEKAIEALGVDVHSQYILSFPQSAAANGRHEIQVAVPNRADAAIHARRAYWAD
jgi:VWFA-related protein